MSGLVGTIDDFLLHESESDHSQESDPVLFEKASTDPLVDSVTNVSDQFFNTGIILDLGPLDGFEEEEVEGFQRVLVHMVHIVQRNDQEVQKSTFISHWSIDFSLLIKHNVGFFSLDLLLFNFDGSVLGVIQLLDQLLFGKDSSRVSFSKSDQQVIF